jgi:hypothetical protein
MKKSVKYIFVLCILGVANQLLAQAIPPAGYGGCAIEYDYDAAGNRIKRSKYCWNPYQNQRAIQGAPAESILEMQVYPNPASTSVSVVLSTELEEAVVELQDISGKLISTKHVHGAQAVFDIRHLAQGAYMVVLKQKNSKLRMVRKLVKE